MQGMASLHPLLKDMHACMSTFLKDNYQIPVHIQYKKCSQMQELKKFFMLFLKANNILSGSLKNKYEDNQTMHTTFEFICKLTSHVCL